MNSPEPKSIRSGGIAEFCVRHREVSWLLLVAVLIWGAVSYGKLAQQEDPKIPDRSAMLVTAFPGASALKVEELVTKKLEKKISELQSIDEIKSESRFGVSVITIALLPKGQAKIDQEWDKLRAKVNEVALPAGCRQPILDTDFGNTVTLLFAITSPNFSDAESEARAELIRSRLAGLRRESGNSNRVAVVAFYPRGISSQYRSVVRDKFEQAVLTRGLGRDIRTSQGLSYILADFASSATRHQIEQFIQAFIRSVAGTDAELHPDFGAPLVIMGGEDPFNEVRAKRMPRYSYRELEVAAEKLEDELKQLPGAGRVRQIGVVPEQVDLLFSIATLNGYHLSSTEVMQAIAGRNALIPGGNIRTEGQVFPVQLTGEFKDESQLLDTVVGLNTAGLPIYLRDIFEVRRGYQNPIRYKADVLTRDTLGEDRVASDATSGTGVKGNDSPLTPALSPLRGEGDAQRPANDLVNSDAPAASSPKEMRSATAAGDSQATVQSQRAPSPLNGERAGARGENTPRSRNAKVAHHGSTARTAPLLSHRAVLVAVEMKDGRIISQFSGEVKAVIREMQSRLPDGMKIETISDQPQAVAGRIKQFTKCFLEAVIIVILVALFLMDWRSALVVAVAIPLTVAMTLGGMHLFNVPLHQISIAALIIALGMLVDDPVVASDGINRELAHGVARDRAAWLGPFKLRRPILFGTLINIVAFLPLILMPGDKGAFIFALPVVVTLALISSRIVSMTFIPLLGFYVLRGQKGLEAGGEMRTFPLFKPVDWALIQLLPRYQRLLRYALAHPWRSMGLAYGLLTLSFGLTPFFGTQFFPPAERNQMLIDVELPVSASLTQTRQTCDDIIRRLQANDEIVSAAVFSGGTAPRFYYNVRPQEPATYLAQILINTRRASDVPRLIVKLRGELDREIAGARCVVKQLEQGPPVESPIQVRLSGDNLDTLRGLADRAGEILRKAGGYRVHDDLGRRMPNLEIDINQDQANTLGIGNQQIGRLAQAAFTGIKVTELREGDHLVPVEIRLRIEERNEADKIRTMYVESPLSPNRSVPISSFATVRVEPEFATIAHFNQLRTTTVKSYASFHELPSKVLQRARPELKQLVLPPGYRIDFGGEDKELRQSRDEMGSVMLLSISLIALAMVFQFNSVLKSVVVMLTVPLGLIGAFMGLAITTSSLGFMALLGLVSLAGVIVSHIIVLSDFIEEARSEGMELKEALVQAGLVRLRAVLVTVLATVGGLIPLALTGGELWKPLTSVHIFGLLFATALTLVMLPALYYVFCAKLKWIR